MSQGERFPHLASTDPDIARLVAQEENRQATTLRLIPSENYASSAVMEATGSSLTNKYSEGYATKRYYQGQEVIDQVELLAIERAKALFGAEHANVQCYSGSPANLAVYSALMEPGQTLMGLSLPHGGHLTHGWKVSMTGKFWKSEAYEVSPDTHLFDYDLIREQVKAVGPQMLIAGTSAYPRTIDFAAFREIADEVGAFFLADLLKRYKGDQVKTLVAYNAGSGALHNALKKVQHFPEDIRMDTIYLRSAVAYAYRVLNARNIYHRLFGGNLRHSVPSHPSH